MSDLDHPKCQVAEVGSPAYFGTGRDPYRPRPFWRLLCWVVSHDWQTKHHVRRCRRCKVTA